MIWLFFDMSEGQVLKQLKGAKGASFVLAGLNANDRRKALQILSRLLKERGPRLLQANQLDLQREKGRISPALYQRLKFDDEKIKILCAGLQDLEDFEDPLGNVQMRTELDTNLVLTRVAVPLGVVCVIFESRPDVAVQLMGLCLKTGNSLILKGGAEAVQTLRAFEDLVHELSQRCDFLPSSWITFLYEREQVRELLAYPEYVDLVIPRGSNELVQRIQSESKVPVLGHADGVCHIYVDRSADLTRAEDLIRDAKIQYPAACNAVETVLIHRDLQKWVPSLLLQLRSHSVEIFGCDKTRGLDSGVKAVADWHHEYGDLALSLKVVDGLSEAIQHINQHGSHHTDAIVSKDTESIQTFRQQVDSACVFVNCSTRFSDGYRFGFGAEVGISTTKTHARGPVGIEGLLSYKYWLDGNGQKVGDYSGPGARAFLHRRVK